MTYPYVTLSSKTQSIMDLIQDPMSCLTPPLMNIYADGTQYLWEKKDIEYMNSFIEKNIRVQLKELWIDLKKIHDEGTYNTWMTDTVTAAIGNVRRLKERIEEGIQVRYYDAQGSVEGLIDKARISMEVPAGVKGGCWELLAEVLTVILEDLEALIPQAESD
jgi:hypothetical protein